MECECNNTNSAICPNCGRHSVNVQHNYIHLGSDSGKMFDFQILPELETFQYSETVKSEITLMFQEATKGVTRRNGPRRAIIFCCVVNVCKKHGVVFDQTELKNKLDITDRNINTAMKEVGAIIGKLSSAISIEDVVKMIMKTFDLRIELFEPIMAIYHTCKRVSVRFNSAKPETIGTGLVYYYLMKNYPEFKQDEFANQSNVAKETILAVYEEIKTILKD